MVHEEETVCLMVLRELVNQAVSTRHIYQFSSWCQSSWYHLGLKTYVCVFLTC